MAEQPFADRARYRDSAGSQVRLFGRDKRVRLFGAVFQVLDADGRKDVSLAVVDLALINDPRRNDGLFYFSDPCFQVALFFLRVIVLGILGDITLRARSEERR